MNDESKNLEPHDPLEAQVEVMVGEHLNAKLGGQLGRAAAAFQAQLQKQTHASELKRTRRTLYYLAIPAALAACIAIAAALITGSGKTPEIAKQNDPAPRQNQNQKVEVAKNPNVDSRTYYRDIDAGVQMISSENGTTIPARQIRRQTVNETQWFDPTQNATMSVTVPREEVVYVQVVPF